MRVSITLASFLVGFMWRNVSAQEAPDGRAMAERTIPPPAGVSAELRELITSRPLAPAMPVPSTREGWLEVQMSWDKANAAAARDCARKHGTTYEPIQVAAVPCFLVTPKRISERFEGRWLVHIHGGAFILNGGGGCVSEAIWVANACNARVLSIDYRRPPVHPFPAAIDDAVAVWKAVIERQDAAETALSDVAQADEIAQLTLPEAQLSR